MPDDWWEKKPDRAHPPRNDRGELNVREELKPAGEGWIVEVRGSTYWHPDTNADYTKFIHDTVLQNIIDRSRPLPEPKTDDPKKLEEAKRAAAEDPIRGKISHVFVYNVWEDKNPSPGSFQHIRGNLIDLVAGSTEGGAGGMGTGAPSGPGTGARGRWHGWLRRPDGRRFGVNDLDAANQRGRQQWRE